MVRMIPDGQTNVGKGIDNQARPAPYDQTCNTEQEYESGGNRRSHQHCSRHVLDGMYLLLGPLIGTQVKAQVGRKHCESAGVYRGHHASGEGEPQGSQQSKTHVSQPGA